MDHLSPGRNQKVRQPSGNETPVEAGAKLGFSIAQIMGFMGAKKPRNEVDIEDNRKSHSSAIFAAENEIGTASRSTAASKLCAGTSDNKEEAILPQPPKLWRPQPFRDFGGPHQTSR